MLGRSGAERSWAPGRSLLGIHCGLHVLAYSLNEQLPVNWHLICCRPLMATPAIEYSMMVANPARVMLHEVTLKICLSLSDFIRYNVRNSVGGRAHSRYTISDTCSVMAVGISGPP